MFLGMILQKGHILLFFTYKCTESYILIAPKTVSLDCFVHVTVVVTRASENGGAPETGTLTVTVIDVNEPPTFINERLTETGVSIPDKANERTYNVD